MRNSVLGVALCFGCLVASSDAWAQQGAGSQAVLTAQYSRATGAPINKCQSFKANSGPGTMTVVNGSPSGENRVSSAVVELNGANILDQRFFNQQQAQAAINVQLLANNNLCVQLASAPGALLLVTVTEPIPALIAGTVRDRNTRLPIANAWVFFYGTAYGTVFTDANGNYAFTAGQLTS